MTDVPGETGAGEGDEKKGQMPAGWIEQPTSSLRVTRSTTELSGLLLGAMPMYIRVYYGRTA